MRKSAAVVTAAASVMTVVAAIAPAQAAVTMAPPSGLTATSVTATTMSLDWNPVSGATAYRVQLSTSSRMGSARYLRFTTNHGALSGLVAKKRYYFRVAVISASSGARLSPYTKATYPSAVTKAIAVPSGLRSTSSSTSAVSLSWAAPEGAAIYQLKRSTSASMSGAKYARSTSPAATLAGLAAGRTYYVTVRVIRADASPLTAWAPVVRVTTAPASDPVPVEPTPVPAPTPTTGPVDVRVGSYNLSSVSLDKTSGEQRPWAQRRSAVVANVMSQDVDVLGLQEANQSTYWKPRLVDGDTQPLDLAIGLNKAGGSYALTNPNNYNCQNPVTGYKCVRTDRGASGDNRILYNTKTIEVVRVGAFTYAAQLAGTTDDSMAWAVLRSRSTGSEFLFTDTHLEPRSGTVKQAQWYETLADIAKIKGDLPVVSVGDYNTNKFTAMAATMFPAQKDAGIGDVLNQQYRVNPARGVRAEHLVDAWINSYNHYYRDVTAFSYSTARAKIGNGIDQIFASNALRVKEYQVVVPYNPSTLQVTGVLASDHNMVRATITIP